MTIFLVANPSCAYDQSAVSDAKSKAISRAEGARVGAFLLKPSIGLIQIYDDNIYRTADDREKDMITSITPEVKFQSNWNLHQFEAGASANLKRYNKSSAENNDDFAFYISGRYDVDYETYFTALLRTERQHEDRSSLDDVDGDAPIEYEVNTGSVGFTRALGILKLYMDATLNSYSYTDSSSAGVAISNADRDRNQAAFKTRLAYGLTDNAQAYAQLTYNRKQYDRDSASFRNSQGYDYRAGLSVNLTGKLEGDAYVGYLNQRYDDTFEDINAPSFGGSLLWSVTELTSLKASAERRVLETSLADSSGVVRTNLELSLQHGLTPDLLVEANFDLDDDTYKGGSVSAGRDNVTYRSGVALNYQFGRGFLSRLAYDFTQRDFKTNDNGYDNSKIMASVVYAY